MRVAYGSRRGWARAIAWDHGRSEAVAVDDYISMRLAIPEEKYSHGRRCEGMLVSRNPIYASG